jgi:hypothetical protein
MLARNPLRTWASLTLLLAVVSVAWAPPEPPAPPRASVPESVAATNLGPEIIISERDSQEHLPAIAYNSKHNEYLVVWENDWGGGYHDIYAQRISGDGQLLSWFALASPLGRSQSSPAVAYDPDNDRYLVVWSYDFSGIGTDWDIYGRFVPWNGPDGGLAEFSICGWPSNQVHPTMAYNRVRQEFLVVWKDAVLPSTISARRVLASGGFPAGGAWTLSPTTLENRDSPDVTYNLHRNEYLVTWDIEINPSDRDIRGIRLRSDGAPLTGGNPTVSGEFRIADYIGANEWTPAVAACAAADQYLVAWQSDQGTGGADHAIYARYLNGDAVPGNIHMIEDTGLPELNVDVDCNLAGDRYLLAWQTQYVSSKYGIWARIAWPNEYLPAQFVVRPAGAVTDRLFPAVAGGRTGFLVAWEHQRDGNGNRDIHGRLVQHTQYLPVVLRQNP